MKKIFAVFIVTLIFVGAFTNRAYALSEEQFVEIQTLLNDSTRISGAPGMSVSISAEDETHYFSSGYAEREKIPATEKTLYELASVSKAFTGVGILLLEEKGLLSMTDTIQKYLPWISFNYKGRPIDMQTITLNHFLRRTSGLTTEKHFQDIPEGHSKDMLLKTVETLKDTELEFSPGQQYQYGTINYDILSLVIEIVSGNSFENYMKVEVFHPLGLNRTYLYREDAQETGQMAQGYRTSIFMKSPYNAPDYAGNKPAGYIISDSEDILEAGTTTSYQKSAMEISDIILSFATIIFTLLAILIFILGLKRRERPKKGFLRKKRKRLISMLTAITFTFFILIWV